MYNDEQVRVDCGKTLKIPMGVSGDADIERLEQEPVLSPNGVNYSAVAFEMEDGEHVDVDKVEEIVGERTSNKLYSIFVRKNLIATKRRVSPTAETPASKAFRGDRGNRETSGDAGSSPALRERISSTSSVRNRTGSVKKGRRRCGSTGDVDTAQQTLPSVWKQLLKKCTQNAYNEESKRDASTDLKSS